MGRNPVQILCASQLNKHIIGWGLGRDSFPHSHSQPILLWGHVLCQSVGHVFLHSTNIAVHSIIQRLFCRTDTRNAACLQVHGHVRVNRKAGTYYNVCTKPSPCPGKETRFRICSSIQSIPFYSHQFPLLDLNQILFNSYLEGP